MRLGFASFALVLVPLGAQAGPVADACTAFGGQSARTQSIADGIGISLADFCTCVEATTDEALPSPEKFREELIDSYGFILEQSAARSMTADDVYDVMETSEFDPGVSEDEQFRRFQLKDRILAAHSFVMRGYRIDNACPS